MRRRLLAPLLALLAVCAAPDDSERILLVTTTTVEASGLLDVLVSAYHAHQDRYRLSTTAVGSGAALELGRRGDADLLITHDPVGEARFMAAGHGRAQGPVMASEFIIAGPARDPAGVRRTADLAEALDRIAGSGAMFISRGDDSGTHRKELELWRRAGRAEPASESAWYIEAGAGMAETLRIADQRGAYVLTDRSTFRHVADAFDLQSLARGEPPEPNPYQYTLPARSSDPAGARDFVEWLRGPGRTVVASYGVRRFGEPLFAPAAPTAAPTATTATPTATPTDTP